MEWNHRITSSPASGIASPALANGHPTGPGGASFSRMAGLDVSGTGQPAFGKFGRRGGKQRSHGANAKRSNAKLPRQGPRPKRNAKGRGKRPRSGPAGYGEPRIPLTSSIPTSSAKGSRYSRIPWYANAGDPWCCRLTDFTGALASLQFIEPDGTKRLLPGGRKQGYPCPWRHPPTFQVILCEGGATGCTLAEDEPEALVLSAIDAGNLEPVAMGTRRRWPSAERVIAGDDDRLTPGNPGAAKARAAAMASGALLALPPWPEGAPDGLTDFNDLVLWERRGRNG